MLVSLESRPKNGCLKHKHTHTHRLYKHLRTKSQRGLELAVLFSFQEAQWEREGGWNMTVSPLPSNMFNFKGKLGWLTKLTAFFRASQPLS